MAGQSEDVMIRIATALGKLEENAKNADRSREMARTETAELRVSVSQLTAAVNELNSRLSPVEELTSDYKKTRNKIVAILALLGIGNLGLGTVGGAIATKYLGGG